jgi:3-deoxy-D-manno-octulosonate 8-phosphate phosphatase (KDO 8-P phosphatase)
MSGGARLSDAEVEARARRITVVGFDVDGVCTDGKLYYGAQGEALHAFHARDGMGIVKARLAGLTLVAISGRSSANVAARLGELKVPFIRQGIWDKAATLDTVLSEVGAAWEQVAFVGDDINDVPCLRRAALAVAVPDAAADVLPFAHLVTAAAGGRGALREVLERVLKAQGKWTIPE